MKTSKYKICLNMIVKNEAHIIRECLESVHKYIDYYIIVDTGSTDNTREVIKEFFDLKGIQGEIINHNFSTCDCHIKGNYKKYPFFHFGHNRTYALDQCRGKSDYIFIMDADDFIEGELKLPSKLIADQYYLNIRTVGSLYFRPLLIKNDPRMKWKWVGGLHECLVGYPKVAVQLEGNYAIVSRRLGGRNLDPLKSLKELEFLTLLVKDSEDDLEMYERYMYYIAQTLFEMGDYEQASKAYLDLVSKTSNKYVQYSCRYMSGRCHVLNKSPSHIIESAFVDCFIKHPYRAEPVYQLMVHFMELGNYKKAYNYGKKGVGIPMPTYDVFYIDKAVYEYKLEEGVNYCKMMLNTISQ